MGFENILDRQMAVSNEVKIRIFDTVSSEISANDSQDETKCKISRTYLLSRDITQLSHLDLSGCNLTAIPFQIANLPITSLILAHNKFNQIPPCLYTGLKTLECLDLSHNFISQFSIVPECVSNLKKLKLNNNNFKNIPRWILTFRTVNLEELDYSMNNSSHYYYLKNSSNCDIAKLKQLTFQNCHLIDEDFSFFKCFRQLKYLDISNKTTNFLNSFADVDELFVKSPWKEMEVLKMSNLSVAVFPEGIMWLESLVELYFTHNTISWLPEGMEFMVNLQVLDLSNNTLVAIPESLLNLEFLMTIKAPHNCIQRVPNFCLLKNLVVLDLYDNLIDHISVDMQGIQHVDIEQNHVVSSTLDFVDEYETKKTAYRESLSLLRSNGHKSIPSEESSDSSSDSESEEVIYMFDTTFDHSSNLSHQEENWDKQTVKPPVPRNPDIDTDDENWYCDVPIPKPRKKEKVYVADEDWMFEDADEEDL